MATPVLVAENVSKAFGTRLAVNDVSLTINEGEILGLIGPNGAGKTTLIRMIAGLAKITKGTIKINGFDIATQFEKAITKVGGIIEEPRMYNHLRGIDNLKYFASLYGSVDMNRIESLAEVCKMQNRIKDKVKTYSLGMRQRLGIMCALIHRPNLLILDEPMNGLDPTGIIELRDFLKKIAKSEKIAIMVSSHNLLEMELLCSQIVIIKNGSIISKGAVAELQQNLVKSQTYSIKVSHPNYAARIIVENFNVKEVSVSQNTVMLKTDETTMQKIFGEIVRHHISIFGVAAVTKSLEEVYLDKVVTKYGGESDAIV